MPGSGRPRGAALRPDASRTGSAWLRSADVPWDAAAVRSVLCDRARVAEASPGATLELFPDVTVDVTGGQVQRGPSGAVDWSAQVGGDPDGTADLHFDALCTGPDGTSDAYLASARVAGEIATGGHTYAVTSTSPGEVHVQELSPAVSEYTPGEVDSPVLPDEPAAAPPQAQPGATASPNFRLIGWSLNGKPLEPVKTDNAVSVPIDADSTLEAHYAQINCTLALHARPVDGGAVAADRQAPYECGSTVTVTATAAPGRHFVRWSSVNGRMKRDADPTTPVYRFTLDHDTAMTAIFAKSDVVPPSLRSRRGLTVRGPGHDGRRCALPPPSAACPCSRRHAAGARARWHVRADRSVVAVQVGDGTAGVHRAAGAVDDVLDGAGAAERDGDHVVPLDAR